MANTTDTQDIATVAGLDITGPLFQIPATSADQMYALCQPMAVSRLTTGSITGTGVFDQLMAAIKVQLRAEYDANRITGGEYTKAYIELTSAALQTASQFALGADQAFWTAQTAQIQAVTGRIAMENARFAYQNTLPAQFAMVVEQGNAQRAQTSDTRLDGTPLAGVLGSQEALYKQQVISYQRDAEVKAAKIFTDAWITQKTIDNGLLPPMGYTNDSVNEVLTVIMARNFSTPTAPVVPVA